MNWSGRKTLLLLAASLSYLNCVAPFFRCDFPGLLCVAAKEADQHYITIIIFYEMKQDLRPF